MKLTRSIKGKNPPAILPQWVDHYAIARKNMIAKQLIARGISDERVIDVMGKTPRHFFVEEAQVLHAHDDKALPVGYGATISQPYIVAYMLEQLKLNPTNRVLDIGMGSGYQTVLLSQLVSQVYAIEVVADLFFKTRNKLKQLSYKNIMLKLGDGTKGWADYAPYDAIVVAAQGLQVQELWLAQLADGGRLIYPEITNRLKGESQLVLLTKQGDQLIRKELIACRFVGLQSE